MSNPWVGAWKMNVARSTLHPPGVASETMTIPPTGADTAAMKYTITGTTGDGRPIDISYEGKADGHLYPLMFNGRQIGTASYRRDAKHRIAADLQFSDGAESTETITLADDDKSFTVRQHVTGSHGTFDQTLVFDKSS